VFVSVNVEAFGVSAPVPAFAPGGADGDAVGAARSDLAARGRMWFVARHEIDYLGEAFVGDEVLVATWLESLGRTSLVRATRILRATDGRELTRARSRWAHVDLATRRPVAIDPDVHAMLARSVCPPA
jgi:acyl-CoA thioester hydrolase